MTNRRCSLCFVGAEVDEPERGGDGWESDPPGTRHRRRQTRPRDKNRHGITLSAGLVRPDAVGPLSRAGGYAVLLAEDLSMANHESPSAAALDPKTSRSRVHLYVRTISERCCR